MDEFRLGAFALDFAFEGVLERSHRRPVEMVLDARDSRGEAVMRTQAGPSSRDLIEWGLL